MFSLTIAAHSWCFLSVSGAVAAAATAHADAPLPYLTGLPWIHQWTGSSCLMQILGPGRHWSMSQSESRAQMYIYLFTALSMLISHTAGIWYYFFWRVWLYNAIIFPISALKYWSKLRLKCIRTKQTCCTSLLTWFIWWLLTLSRQQHQSLCIWFMPSVVGGCICVWLFIVGPHISDTLA